MYKLPNFADRPVQAIATRKEQGNIDPRFGDQEAITTSLNSIITELNIPLEQIYQLNQIHSAKVHVIDKNSDPSNLKPADAMVTNRTDVALMLKLADCAPVYLYDPTNHAIGLAHSGWRGTVGKITLVAVQTMMRTYGSLPQNIIAAIGPSIKAGSYTTPDKPLQSQLPEWEPYIKQTDSGHSVDVAGFINFTLLEAGLPQDHIYTSEIDTATDPDYYSHFVSLKTGEPEGRFAAIMKLGEL